MTDLPLLDHRHYALLLALEDTGTVRDAADRLGLTQSAASHRLAEAERRLGLDLTERRGRRVFLTPAARSLIAAGRPALESLARAERRVMGSARAGKQVVRFGQSPYSRLHWLPAFLDILVRHHPEVDIDLVPRAAVDPLGTLRNGAADLVVVYGPEEPSPDLLWLRLGADPLVAVMAPDHPLATKPYVEAHEIAEERYITYTSRPVSGFEWEQFFRPGGIAPQRVSHLESPEAILDLLRAGYGVSILSRWAVSPEVAAGTLAAVPLGATGISVAWWAVLRKTAERGPAAAVANLLQSTSAEHGVGLNVRKFGDEPGEGSIGDF
ncbi:MAG: LysR family transcriptional regulator [Alphaproteobacteria bacterium]|nr:LysR family transcriptional regulator [Alphaproteobacteria bacterium]